MQLIIAEKPSVAKEMATVLGADKKNLGYYQGNDYLISWCVGHLIGLAEAHTYNPDYKKWRKTDLPIVPEPFDYQVAEGKEAQIAILKTLMKRPDVTSVINACDAGREGELIFGLVYSYNKCSKPVQRLWISSLESAAILQGLADMKDGADYQSLYDAALCRSEADWLVGINGTRLFTLLYGETLNVGRVLTPTLALLVARHKQIEQFTPQDFHELVLTADSLSAKSTLGKLSAKEQAQDALNNCGETAVVTKLDTAPKSTAPPKLFDLTSLQREANSRYGFTAQQTLDLAQSLYEKRLITYPRTDSRYLPSDMEHKLPELASFFGMGSADTIIPSQVINDKKVTDHHAIIPTSTKDDATADEDRLLFLIINRFVVAMSPAYEILETNLELDSQGVTFTTRGYTVVNHGYKLLENLLDIKEGKQPANAEDKPLPALAVGEVISPITVAIKTGKTTPPKPYTEASLLSAMETAGASDTVKDAERKGLGTPATRAGVIEKLVNQGFVQRDKKQILPTAKGQNLITVMPDIIKSPTLTADWENDLKEVEKGTLSRQTFMANITNFVNCLVDENQNPQDQYTSLFSTSSQFGTKFTDCPKCKGELFDRPKSYSCGDNGCGFVFWKDNRFFSSQGVVLKPKQVKTLLESGELAVEGLISKKTGKPYNATVTLDATGQTAQFGLKF